MMLVAKSKLTTVCTERTRGVARPASNRYAVSYRCQCRADPRQPRANIPYPIFKSFALARSRSVARSGINPTYQKSRETVAYVETAKTSQTRGLRVCGQIAIVLG